LPLLLLVLILRLVLVLRLLHGLPLPPAASAPH